MPDLTRCQILALRKASHGLVRQLSEIVLAPDETYDDAGQLHTVLRGGGPYGPWVVITRTEARSELADLLSARPLTGIGWYEEICASSEPITLEELTACRDDLRAQCEAGAPQSYLDRVSDLESRIRMVLRGQSFA